MSDPASIPLLPEELAIKSKHGAKESANFFCTIGFLNPLGHGRPRRNSWTSAPSVFSCGGGDGIFDSWAFGRKGEECPQEIQTERFMFMFLLPSQESCSGETVKITFEI